MSKGKILYVRSGPYELSFDSYNLQEVGLGKAFCAEGYDFDIVYYTKNDNRIQIIDVPDNILRIHWMHGIKLLRSGIYPQILKKEFLNRYDAVIVSEYSQIMSVLIAQRHPQVYIYNGPYYNLFKIPPMEAIYDRLFCKYINGHAKKVFCKTQMSKDYLARKGITNTEVVGVGLDPDRFENEEETLPETQKLLQKLKGKKNLLYVGQIIPRKNTELIVKSFVLVKKEENDLQLVLVGSGDKEYRKKCEALIPDSMKESVIWCPFIKNAQLKYIYQNAIAFLLPSTKEIFGMVLLEAMYFGLPVITSHSAGADTVVENGINSVIVEGFDEISWSQAIYSLYEDQELRTRLGNAAKEAIYKNYMWRSIAQKMVSMMEN